MDRCDRCNKRAELFHNERTGLSLCETCDAAVEEENGVPKRISESVEHALKIALKHGVGYEAGFGNTAYDPSYAVLIVTGETANELRKLLDAARDLASKV